MYFSTKEYGNSNLELRTKETEGRLRSAGARGVERQVAFLARGQHGAAPALPPAATGAGAAADGGKEREKRAGAPRTARPRSRSHTRGEGCRAPQVRVRRRSPGWGLGSASRRRRRTRTWGTCAASPSGRYTMVERESAFTGVSNSCSPAPKGEFWFGASARLASTWERVPHGCHGRADFVSPVGHTFGSPASPKRHGRARASGPYAPAVSRTCS